MPEMGRGKRGRSGASAGAKPGPDGAKRAGGVPSGLAAPIPAPTARVETAGEPDAAGSAAVEATLAAAASQPDPKGSGAGRKRRQTAKAGALEKRPRAARGAIDTAKAKSVAAARKKVRY